jgi:hypothetical protein
MKTPRQAPSSADVAAEVTSLSGGLGLLMVPLFPLALPGLLLFVIAPLALVAVVGVLLATPVVLPLWLTRIVLRSRSRRRSPVVPASDSLAARTLAYPWVPPARWPPEEQG